jgi:hypothetical protein
VQFLPGITWKSTCGTCAFEVLLRERNLTRAATVLGVAQPVLSKTLAKRRRYFADPQSPTPKHVALNWAPRPPSRAVVRA